MEQEKNNKGVITLLVIIIVILLALVILFATGTISLKNTTTNGNINSIYDIVKNSKENLYDNIEMNKETLDELYYLIGALPEDNEEITAPRHCLNTAVTNTTYLGIPFAKDVFSWYVIAYKKQADYDKYKDAVMYVDNGNLKVSAYNCAACFTIEKTEVDKFKKLYYFGPEEEFEFITDNIENYDNIYSAVHSLGSPVHCDYNVKHNITKVDVKKGTEGETIYLTDEQIVTRYDDVETDDVSQLTKQTITYSFYKKNGNDTYELDNVFHGNIV